ncbi:MAG: hypothetical protein ACHBN1_27050 [Heteroscytonema crispum UTEX LB 1556]
MALGYFKRSPTGSVSPPLVFHLGLKSLGSSGGFVYRDLAQNSFDLIQIAVNIPVRVGRGAFN